MINIARSTFYYRRKAPSPETDADLTDRIEAICLEFPGYGYRRVTKQLQRGGKVINHKKVLRADAGERPALPGKKEVGKDIR